MILKHFFDAYYMRRDKEPAIFKKICKENKLSEKKLRVALQQLGYYFDQKTKQYYFNGKPPEPLELNLMSIAAARISALEAHNDDYKSAAAAHIEHIEQAAAYEEPDILETQLMYIKGIHNILKDMQLANSKKTDPLQQQIFNITKKEKTRKTLTIEKYIASQLDDYAENNNLNKSDIVSIALIDFFSTLDKHKE